MSISGRCMLISAFRTVVLLAYAAITVSCSDSPSPKSVQQPSQTISVAASPAQPESQRPIAGQQGSARAECVALTNVAAAPRKLRDRKPELSADLRAIRTHGGVLVYQVTIAASGNVTEARLAKPVDAEEPWPTLAEGWRVAILDWLYEPTVVNGKAVAVCMTTTVTIDVM